MRIRVLGSAAGGGFPQWNCACFNCLSVRNNKSGFRSRTQSQVAICADRDDSNPKWHLLNGSPDLRQQLLSYPDMLPSQSTPRSSPIQSITITNADIDHTLGLLLLRESHPLRVHTSHFVREALLEGNAFFGMLQQFTGQCDWRSLESEQKFELMGPDNKPTQLFAQVKKLQGSVPFWAKDRFPKGDLPVIGLIIEEPSGARFGYFPGVAQIDSALVTAFSSCDLLFLDGTFWTDDEIQRLKGSGRTAAQMGHVPMSGKSGSLETLRSLPSTVKKLFIHINNTNPVLNELGPEHEQMRKAGWEIAFDGMEINL